MRDELTRVGYTPTLYLKEHPNGEVPEMKSLAKDAASRLADELKERMGVPKAASHSEMTRLIDGLGLTVDGIRADHSGFSVRRALLLQDIRPGEYVFINWHQYDEIDQIGLADLDKYFEYIWYPSADDIDVFDSSCAWVLSISHDGEIKVTKAATHEHGSGAPRARGAAGSAEGRRRWRRGVGSAGPGEV